MLAAGAGCPVDLHFNVLGVDLHIHLFHFRQHRHRGGGGVDPAAGFRFRHTLDPVDTGFVLHPAVSAPSVNDEVRFLHAAQLCFVVIHQFDAPAHFCGIHGVHPEQTVGKEGAFFAAHAAPDLHDDIFVIIGIFRQQQKLKLFKQFLFFRFRGLEFLLSQLLHFRITHQFPGIQNGLLCPAVGFKRLYDGLQVIFLPEEFGGLLGIGVKVRLLRLGAKLFIPVRHGPQFIQHKGFLSIFRLSYTNFVGEGLDPPLT